MASFPANHPLLSGRTYRSPLRAALAGCLVLMAWCLADMARAEPATASPSAPWVQKAFEDVAGPETAAVEAFLNTDCRPSDLDGVLMLAVQGGHLDRFNLHVYCRQDGALTAHYKVSLLRFDKGAFNPLVLGLLSNTELRLGPFYFGKPGEQDGLVLIEHRR